jgi:hypothetical protein
MAFAVVLVGTACSSRDESGGRPTTVSKTDRSGVADTKMASAVEVAVELPSPLPPARPVPTGPISNALGSTVMTAVAQLTNDTFGGTVPAAIGVSKDVRLGWVLSDLLRFTGPDDQAPIVDAFDALTGVDLATRARANDASVWQEATELLIAWDIPAYPQYVDFKRSLFETVDLRWKPIFSDPNADIDWRFLSWGGVYPDDRALGDTRRCVRGCIRALDDPPMTSADEGSWYPDERIVFGVVLGDTAMAFPKNIMEIHEMVNFSIEGRRVGFPYCTLCGSAQAFFTDRVAGVKEPLVLRTSGLLVLSNKVMYDLESGSAFDTFKGRAVSGPLHEDGVTLPMLTTVVSRWGDWKAAHPHTTIIAKDGGIDESYDLDPLRGRDDNGPIFPINRADTRLGVHTQVVGVLALDGTPVAFPVDAARAALLSGKTVELQGVSLEVDAGGLRATSNGKELESHQSFWFAWAQFHPGTVLWSSK